MSRASVASAVVVGVIGVLILGFFGSMIFDDGEVYDIEYVLDDGTLNGSAVNTYTSGKSADLPVAYKEGFMFVGWFTDSKFTEPLGSITKDVRGNLTLYALWKTDSLLKTEYELSGGVVYKVVGYDKGISTYNIEINGSTLEFKDGDEKLIYIGNATVDEWNCAVWEYENLRIYINCGTPLKIVKGSYTYSYENSGYDITYVLNGGSLPSDAKTKYIWGGEYDLLPAYKDGYYFDGWYTDSAFTEAKLSFTNEDDSYTVYAKWNDESPVGKQYDAVIDGKTVSVKAYNYDHGKTYYAVEEGGVVKETFWTYSDKVQSSAVESAVKWSIKDYEITYDGGVTIIKKSDRSGDVTPSTFKCSKPFVLVDINIDLEHSTPVEYGKSLNITLGSSAKWIINSKEQKQVSYSLDEFIPGTEITIHSDQTIKVGKSVNISELGLEGTVIVINSDGKATDVTGSYDFEKAGEYCFSETGKSYNRFIYVESGDMKVFNWNYKGDYTLTLSMYESDVSEYKNKYPMKKIVNGKYSMEDHTRVYLYYEGHNTDEAYAEYVDKFFCDDKYVTELAQKLKDLYQHENEGEIDRTDYANYVLHFVGAMKYITDKDSTKGMYPDFDGFDEYYKFPAETLFDMGGDCEDSSILYAALMKVSGYETGIVTLPGHAMAIVSLDDTIDGAKFTENGKTYYFCETTNVFDVGKLEQDETTGATSDVSKVDHRFYLEALKSTS